MRSTLRKIAVQITIPLLCGLIGLNAYLVVKNLKRIQKVTTERLAASQIQSDISQLLIDLQDMETGQRGYLLTGDDSYLRPYSDANTKLTVHFANLRSRLAGKAPQARELETRLESVTEAKIAEMKETIRLRELGYRHRAFQIVGSNRGQELMNQARAALDALSSGQSSAVARYDRDIKESVRRAIKDLILASCALLAVTVAIFLAFNRHSSRLEARYARSAQQLQATSRQLEEVTSTVFHDVRARVGKMRSCANALLDTDGGFLPRQGQEKAERIEHEAGQMILLLDNLFKTSGTEASVKVVEVQALQKLSA